MNTPDLVAIAVSLLLFGYAMYQAQKSRKKRTAVESPDPHAQGYAAYYRCERCPYEKGSEAWLQWHEGYTQAINDERLVP